MKKIWLCEWEIAPGDGKHKKKFSKYSEANAFIRSLLVRSIDISTCVEKILAKGDYLYSKAIAEFLTRYFTDEHFPYSESDIPSDNPEDYPDYESYPEDDDFFSSDDCCEEGFDVSAGGFLFLYEGYDISSDFVLEEADIEKKYRYGEGLRCEYENGNGYSNGNGANDMVLHLTSDTDWGTNANPIMILRVLQNAKEPMLQQDIIREIENEYGVTLERKAIGRNIDMLKALGYNIQQSRSGYLLQTDKKE